MLTAAPATHRPADVGHASAYLPRNTRPVVTSITVHPPGVVFQRPFSSEDGAIAGLDDAVADARRPPGDRGPADAVAGRRMFQKGLQTLAWKAEDADGDRLAYTLQYRREGETDVARPASRADRRPIFVWDTTSVADGRYVVRVVASDAPSNAADRALTGDRESDPVDVDNTPPAITTEVVRTGGAARLVVRVRDAQSPIQKLEYSLGGAVAAGLPGRRPGGLAGRALRDSARERGGRRAHRRARDRPVAERDVAAGGREVSGRNPPSRLAALRWARRRGATRIRQVHMKIMEDGRAHGAAAAQGTKSARSPDHQITKSPDRQSLRPLALTLVLVTRRTSRT